MTTNAKLRLLAAGLLSPFVAAAPVGIVPVSPVLAAPTPLRGQATPQPLTEEQIGSALGVDEGMAAAIAADIQLRTVLHFSTDLEHVARLRMEPETADPEYPEIPMTSDEAAEFAARQALSQDFEVLDGILSEQAAATYAGSWIDNAAGELVVNSTDAGAEQARRIVASSDVANPDRIRVDVVAHSWRDLLVVQQRLAPVVAERETLPYDVFADVSENGLRAIFPPDMDPAERARVEEALASSGLPYRVEVEAMPTATSGTLRNDAEAPPVVAGHGIIVTNNTTGSTPNQGNYCTMAFRVRRGTSSKQFGLTAAHCFYGDGWTAPIDSKTYYYSHYNASNTIGTTEGYLHTSGLDLGLVEYSGDTPSKIIISAASDTYRDIDWIWNSLSEGTTVCAVGASANNVACGPIDSWSDGGNQIRADIPNRIPGDSGGPVYTTRPNMNAGVVGVTSESNGSTIRASNVTTDLNAFCGDCVIVGS